MLTLRPYQQNAVQAVYHLLRNFDTNPVVVIPTGGGKTPVMATICRDAVQQWNGRVLVLVCSEPCTSMQHCSSGLSIFMISVPTAPTSASYENSRLHMVVAPVVRLTRIVLNLTLSDSCAPFWLLAS